MGPVQLCASCIGRTSGGTAVRGSRGRVFTPTYVPDLVETSLNLIVDGERGLWHLTNVGAVSWFALARLAAIQAGLDPATVSEQRADDCNYLARRPTNSALHSNRAVLLPTLENAMTRFMDQRASVGGAIHIVR